MDREPDCGSVGSCNDLGSEPCPVSLPVWEILRRGCLCSLGMGGSDACDITVPCAHVDIACAVLWENELEKVKACFLEILNIEFHFQVCPIHDTNNLGTGRMR